MPTPPANQLANESSPYLQQHATNPVDWLPWGDEAFARAKAEDKPVFLSIGYSTCHWCHVMAHESFENAEVAAVMNEHFINVKVDREERPDVDRVYMAFVQASTGGGGWPMSVWMTPERTPFYAGTYYPPDDRWGRPGFVSILQSIAKIWRDDRERVEKQATHSVQVLQQFAGRSWEGDGTLDPALIERAYTVLWESFDEQWGGFGGAPKFPRPAVLHMLWRVHAAARDRGNSELAESAKSLASVTLSKIVAGGIHDHVGGGFHRYSVDAHWHVPHFEKMLYDQGQLVVALVEGYLITGDTTFAHAVRDTLDYVGRDLSAPGGGFYSAEDADSTKPDNPGEHGEGAFYVWSAAELRELLGERDAAMFARHYGVEDGGNAAEGADPHGEFTGLNVLIRRETITETAEAVGESVGKTEAVLKTCCKKLFAAREKRPRPHRDEKVLTAWNGLMVSGYARAAMALSDPDYRQRAEKAAEFMREHMRDSESGELYRTWTNGKLGGKAFAEDYACLIQGLLDLYEATLDWRWIDWATELQRIEDKLFWDEAGGGYFSSSGRDQTVLVRLKDDHDGAEPAASSVSAMNLLRLGRLNGDESAIKLAEKTMRAFVGAADRSAQALPYMMCVLADWLRPSRQVVLAGERGAADFEALRAEVSKRYLPGIVVTSTSSRSEDSKPPWLEEMTSVDGRAAAYVCKDFACQLPVKTAADLAMLLDPEKA